MNNIGLSHDELQLLLHVFGLHPEIQKVVLFGSRAKGTYRKNSDIDLAVWGTQNELYIALLAQELDELPLPYKFDIQAYDAIVNPDLRNHIDRVGIVIYKAG